MITGIAGIQARGIRGLTEGVGMGRNGWSQERVGNEMAEPNYRWALRIWSVREGEPPGRTLGFWSGQPGDGGTLQPDKVADSAGLLASIPTEPHHVTLTSHCQHMCSCGPEEPLWPPEPTVRQECQPVTGKGGSINT